MNDFRITKCLEPKRVSEHSGRGEFTQFISGYKEVNFMLNMDTVVRAQEVFINYREHWNAEDVFLKCIQLDIAKGHLFSTINITYDAFQKLFGFPWPTEDKK